MKYFAFFQALLADQQKNAQKHFISRHLARVALYELKGKKALEIGVLGRFERLEKRMKILKKPIWLVEGFRTAATQDDYYAEGRTKPGNKITNAKGLQSYHQYGIAFDVTFKRYNWKPPSSDWWNTLGEEGKKLDLEWGGDWKFRDVGHFQWTDRGKIKWEIMEPYFKS